MNVIGKTQNFTVKNNFANLSWSKQLYTAINNFAALFIYFLFIIHLYWSKQPYCIKQLC